MSASTAPAIHTGCVADDIPQSARIIGGAGVYNVLTARAATAADTATHGMTEELRRVADRQLDARLVEHFLTAIPQPAVRASLDRELVAARRMATRVHTRATII